MSRWEKTPERSGDDTTMPAHAPIPPAQHRRAGQVNDLLPLGDWVRHHSLRSWPVLLFLVLICVPSIALVILGGNPSASTFDHVAWIFAIYFAIAWLLLGVIIRPEHVTRTMLVAVTAIALVTQVPLAIALETELHSSSAALGQSIFTIGIPEELAKALPVLVVALIYRRRHGLMPRDYLFLGAVSGLVFGASEVVHYFTVNGLAEFYQTVQSAIPQIEQLLTTGHSASASVFEVLIGPVLYFILDFVLAVRHRPGHPCLLVRPNRLFHRAGGDRTLQVVPGRLDRTGHRRDPARAERLEPGERPPGVDPGRAGQRHPVPRLREGRIRRRPARSRGLVGLRGACDAGRAARRTTSGASAPDADRALRARRAARKQAKALVGALTEPAGRFSSP